MKNIKNIFLTMIFIIPLFFIACKDDLDSKELKAYINLRTFPVNTHNLVIKHTPLFTKINDSVLSFPLMLTRPTSANVDVQLVVDNSMVNLYNTKNKTKYKEVPTTNVEFTENVRIEEGKVISKDSFKIKLLKYDELINTDGYLIPIRINSLNTKDKGVEVSSNMNLVYLIIHTYSTNINSDNLDNTGKNIDRSKWQLNASSNEDLLKFMIDGNIKTGWSYVNQKDVYFQVDMKERKTISGFRISGSSLPSELKVETSDDGANWHEQGICNLVKIKAKNKPINFYKSVAAQYFRFTIISNDYYVTISEINAVE